MEEKIVAVNPKPKRGLTSKLIDWFENVVVKLMYDTSQPHHYLSGNFAPVEDETPPTADLPVSGSLPECLNGEFVRVGPNPKFDPVAGYHWFDGDGMIHGVRNKDGKATYVSRYVKTSRLKQEEYFGGAKFSKLGDLKGLFGLLMFNLQALRGMLKVLDLSYGRWNRHFMSINNHKKLSANWNILKVLEDGDLQTLGMLGYDKRLDHTFTAHPKVDPFTGFMHDPMPITIPEPVMMPLLKLTPFSWSSLDFQANGILITKASM